MNTTAMLVYKWKDIDWRKTEQTVFKLQKRIYRATHQDNQVLTRKLQKLLLSSQSAKHLAVRKVTQDNRGKKTAGTDGKVILNHRERLQLAQNLKLNLKVTPVRRVWIPKPGSQELRPLGIPTIGNRAQQALAKLALEPEWEARFEPNSYGFRPGRSAHDAIEAIQSSLKYTRKYVLDADIAKCFDRINHAALLSKLDTFKTMRQAIKTWLKTGIMDKGKLFPAETGTPQGGVISPLLANIALHGLETAITMAFPHTVKIKGVKHERYRPRIIRYADDFVVLHQERATIEQAKGIAEEWLKEMGLELKPSKTRIAPCFSEAKGEAGFDFLGFHIRQFPVGKCHYRKSGHSGITVTFKTIIKPRKEAVQRHYEHVAAVIDSRKTSQQKDLINQLNPMIRGWANYYATVVSKQIFSKLDHLVTKKLLRWAYRRHPHESRKQTVGKYWKTAKKRFWNFQTLDETRLHWYADVPIQRHVQVASQRSPYDGDWVYWGKRLRNYPILTKRQITLLKRQKGICFWCGLYFKFGDSLEVDHRWPHLWGGKDTYDNLQLLHQHCHDEKTAEQIKTFGALADGINDNDYIVEEPCEVESLMHGSEEKEYE